MGLPAPVGLVGCPTPLTAGCGPVVAAGPAGRRLPGGVPDHDGLALVGLALVGLDVRRATADHLATTRGDRPTAPLLLRAEVTAGDLGRTTGRRSPDHS